MRISEHYRLLLLLLLCWHVPAVAQRIAEMPIIAYWGVPDTMTTDQHFRDFKACGFNVSIYPYWQLSKLVKACETADKYGIGIIGRCPELFKSTAQTARTLKNTKGFLGYFIQDEPSLPEIAECQKTIQSIKAVDDSHLFYVNLMPFYREDWFTKSTKASSFKEYVTRASSIASQQLSFDFYPITDEGIRTTWYHNLEVMRQASLSTGKPFWGFVLSVPHSVYPTPTLASLRLQIYSNLAYGAQAIQYFTYWSPTPTNFNYHDAPIDLQGKKTKTYTIVQQMNRELRQVAPLFYGASVLSVHHLGAIPQGTTRQSSVPKNIKSLKVSGKQGAIVTVLEKEGHQYLALVNKSHKASLTVSIKAANSVPKRLSKQLQEGPLKSSYKMSGGDLLLFRID